MKKIAITLLLFLFSVPFYAQNVELDKLLGEQNAKMVESEMGIYKDADKTAYVRRVGNRLVAELENPLFEYQFHLVEDPSPNAFALPGGYLYVTTGLIPILESEDELACILGHEIIHSNNRHSVKQLKKSIFPKLLEIPGNLIGVIDEDLGALFNAPIETSNSLLFASYGRKSETEADEEGIRLAAKAGYNPNAMITALTRLSKTVEVATQQEEQKSYFNDHPYTPDRTKAIQSEIAELNMFVKEPVSSNFLNEFEGTLFGQSPGKGVVNENVFIHPDLDFYIEFPEKWTIDNQNAGITAYNNTQQSGIHVTLVNPTISPENSAKQFIENLKSEYKGKMTGSQLYQIGDKNGFLISFQDKTANATVYAYALWMPLNDKLFNIMGIATHQELKLLEQTVHSLRKLTAKEKNNVKVNRMHIVHAKEGETIESLSERTGNILTIDLTSVINAKTSKELLKRGEQIKIIKSYPY
ncbi:M48 family metalloprotease [Lutibacter holmesii]|uniref:M48 family metalloprotease n=1 Tax=Lutibacter holmesii TaxID=1137985 RepID=A0ABW3WMC4_9FLAO